MKGEVLDFSLQNNSGIITTEDGTRFEFINSKWKSPNSFPKKGETVDFIANGESAIEIYSTQEQQAVSTDKNIIIKTAQTSSAAVASMIFGIIGFFLDWWLFAIPSIIAIITGHIAKSNIARSDGMLSGNGIATVGLILGYLVTLVYLLVLFVFAGLVASVIKT